MIQDFEARVSQALTDHNGPPELAPQLVALAEKHELAAELLQWIAFHIGEEWSAAEFNTWAWKFKRTRNGVLELDPIASAADVLKEMR